jgi:hypothetical protein
MFPFSYPDKKVILGFVFARIIVAVIFVLFVYEKSGPETEEVKESKILREINFSEHLNGT